MALQGGMTLIGVGIAAMALILMDSAPIALAYVAWTVAGLGIGALYPTVSVLVLELSKPGEEGRNSASLGVGETVFTVVAVAVTSALFTATGQAYLVGFAFTFAVTVLGVFLAPRFAQSVTGGTMEEVRS
jgi:MFS family permease